MPTFRDVTIHVTDKNNVPLVEWGVRQHNRSRQISCFIQSVTDMRFCVSLKPAKLPFPTWHDSSDEDDDDDDDYYNDDEYGYPVESSSASRDGGDGAGRSRHSGRRTSRGSTRRRPREVSWHLLATLRLDGRRKFEAQRIILLDKGHSNFRHPEGEVHLSSRRFRDDDGGLRECGWVFKEVGVERMLEKLLLSRGDDGVVPAEDDDFLTAFGALGANNMEDAEEEGSVGQIELTLERVSVGIIHRDVHFAVRHDQDTDMDIGHHDGKMKHSAGRDVGAKARGRYDTIKYEPYRQDELLFATFKFYYRSEETLRKIGFQDFPPSKAALRKGMQSLSTLTPLSLTEAKAKKDGEGGDAVNGPEVAKSAKDDKSGTNAVSSGKTLGQRHLWKPLWKPMDSKLKDVPQVVATKSFSGVPVTDGTASPPNQDRESAKSDGDNKASATSAGRKSKPAISLRITEAKDSSADEPSPPKQASAKSTADQFSQFRKLTPTPAEGEEADDEASDGDRSADSMSFLADDGGDAVGNSDNGIGGDQPDQGLGEGMSKIHLGKRGLEDGDSSATEGTAKKSKVREHGSTDDGVSRAEEGSVEEDVAGVMSDNNDTTDQLQVAGGRAGRG